MAMILDILLDIVFLFPFLSKNSNRRKNSIYHISALKRKLNLSDNDLRNIIKADENEIIRWEDGYIHLSYRSIRKLEKNLVNLEKLSST